MKFFIPNLISIFCQGNVQLKGNLTCKLYGIYAVTIQGIEEIPGLVVEKIDV